MSFPQYLFQHSVLVIDDPRGFERLIREGLFSCSAVFEFCISNSEDASEALRRQRPDLVLISRDFQGGSVTDFVEQNADILQQLHCICMGINSEWAGDLVLLRNYEVLERDQLPKSLPTKFEQLVIERQRRAGTHSFAKS